MGMKHADQNAPFFLAGTVIIDFGLNRILSQVELGILFALRHQWTLGRLHFQCLVKMAETLTTTTGYYCYEQRRSLRPTETADSLEVQPAKSSRCTVMHVSHAYQLASPTTPASRIPKTGGT